MAVLAEVRDKEGGTIKIIIYQPSFKDRVVELFKEGYPDSFDEYDLECIEESLGAIEEGETEEENCFLAMAEEKLLGASFFDKVAGPQDQWENSYIFTKENLRKKGIGRILVGVQEEYLKNEARILFATNPGILPEDVVSYPFWRAVGYEEWGILPGYFRDDLSGIFLVKRNPYYRIGKGIPRNSGWCPEMADSRSGERISQEEYRNILHGLKPVSKEKWGLDLIGRENVLDWKV